MSGSSASAKWCVEDSLFANRRKECDSRYWLDTKVRYGTVRCITVRCGTVHVLIGARSATADTGWTQGTVRCGAVRYGTVQYGMVCYGMVQCSTCANRRKECDSRYWLDTKVRYGTVRYGMVWTKVRYGTVRYGMVRCGMVQCVTVLCVTVWCGVVHVLTGARSATADTGWRLSMVWYGVVPHGTVWYRCVVWYRMEL